MSSPKRFNPISVKLSAAYAILSVIVVSAFAVFALVLVNNYSSQSSSDFDYGYGIVLPYGSDVTNVIVPEKDFEIDIKGILKDYQLVRVPDDASIQHAGGNFYFEITDNRILLLSSHQMPFSGVLHERTFYYEPVQTTQDSQLLKIGAVNNNYLMWKEVSSYITWSLIFFALAVVVIAIVFAVFISNQLTKPLRQIASAVSRTDVATLGEQIHVKSNDEVGLVADAYNRMSKDLSQAIEAQKRFVADAAHELKTPLSALTTATTKALEGEEKSSEEYIEVLEFINLNLYNMKSVVNDLLYIARLEEDTGTKQDNEKPLINLENIAANIYETFLPLCEEKGVIFQVRWRDIYVHADDEKILRLLINLVGNAVKNSEKGGLVSVAFGATQEDAVIVVSDTGGGIPAEHLDKIFNRFYKVPGADSYNEGTGLGLAICRAIVENHGGQISVQSKQGKGTTFSISIPLAKEITNENQDSEEREDIAED